MIPQHLRLFFAKERRPLLLGHLVLALALVPIPMIRTGWAEMTLVFTLFPFRIPASTGPLLLAIGLVISSPLAPIFLAWSLPGATRTGLPKRSIGALCLLIVYHPFRIYLEGIFSGPEDMERVARLHDELPIIWVIKHLDTPLLLVLGLWAIYRRGVAQPIEKIWFHWLLFVGALWAITSLSDSGFGFLGQFFFIEPRS